MAFLLCPWEYKRCVKRGGGVGAVLGGAAWRRGAAEVIGVSADAPVLSLRGCSSTRVAATGIRDQCDGTFLDAQNAGAGDVSKMLSVCAILEDVHIRMCKCYFFIVQSTGGGPSRWGCASSSHAEQTSTSMGLMNNKDCSKLAGCTAYNIITFFFLRIF